MMTIINPQTDYDSPWKEALEQYFQDFMAFCFPKTWADIDWSKSYEFLDKELQQVMPDGATGRRLVDKLVKVWRKSGEETWVLVHIEVQGDEEATFAERMYIYNYRLFDRYKYKVASMAVLADEKVNWRPNQYSYSLWDCEITLKYPIIKLLDYEKEWDTLEKSDNPFSVMVMAHLKTKRTKRDDPERLAWKLAMVKGLHEKGYNKRDILLLFRFIDWLMQLTDELEKTFEAEITAYEEAQKVTYITSIERIGIKKGLEEGIQQGELKTAREGILSILEARFGPLTEATTTRINQSKNILILKNLLKQAAITLSLAEFEMMLDDEKLAE